MNDWRRVIGEHNNSIVRDLPSRRHIKLWELIYQIYTSLLAIEDTKKQISQTSLQISESFYTERRSRSHTSSPNLVTAIFFLVLFYPELVQCWELSFDKDLFREDIVDSNKRPISPLSVQSATHFSKKEINSETKKPFKKSYIKKSKNQEINLLDKESYTKLMRAAMKGDRQQVQQLLKGGADIEICNLAGDSALMQAVTYNFTDITKDLLVAGANPNTKNNNKMTPLFIACEKGFLSVAELLIQYDADVNLCRSDGITPIYLAVNNNHTTIANLLVKHGAEIDKYINEGEKFTTLHHAALNNNPEAITILIELGSNLEIIDQYGQTPLFIAVKHGYFGAAEVLVKKGANVNTSNDEAVTLLIQAVKNKDLAIVKLLLENNVAVNEFTGKGNPLLHAILNGDADMVGALLKYNADINIEYENGNTPIMRAIAANKPEILKLLIENGASLDLKNKSGFTALHLAVCYGTLESISLLLINGIDQNIPDNHNYLPAETVVYYIKYTESSIFKENAKAGKDFYDQYLKIARLIEAGYYSNAVFEIKQSPAEYRRQEIFQKLLTQAEIVTTLEVESYSWKNIIIGLFVLLAVGSFLVRDRLAKFFGAKQKSKPIHLSPEVIDNLKKILKDLLKNIAEIEHISNNEFSLKLLELTIEKQTYTEITKNLSKELLLIIKTYLNEWGAFNVETGNFTLDLGAVTGLITLPHRLTKNQQLKAQLDHKLMENLCKKIENSINQLLADLKDADELHFFTIEAFNQAMDLYSDNINKHLNDNKKWKDAESLLETEKINGVCNYKIIKFFKEEQFENINNEFNETISKLSAFKTKDICQDDFVEINKYKNTVEGLEKDCKKYINAANELHKRNYENRLDEKIAKAVKQGVDSYEKQYKRKLKSKWNAPTDFLAKSRDKATSEVEKSEIESKSKPNEEAHTRSNIPKQNHKESQPAHHDLYEKLPQTSAQTLPPQMEKIILMQVNRQQLSIAKDLCEELTLLLKKDSDCQKLPHLVITRVFIILNIQILECVIQASQKNELENYFHIVNIKKFRSIFRKFWTDFINPEFDSREVFLESSNNTAKLLYDDFLPFCLENKKILGNYNPEGSELYKLYSSLIDSPETKIFFKSSLFNLQNEIIFIKESLTFLQGEDITANKQRVYEKSLQTSVLFIGYLRRVFRENNPEIFSELPYSEDKSKICRQTRENIYQEFFCNASKPPKRLKTKNEIKTKKSIFNAKTYGKFKIELKDPTKTPFFDLLILLSQKGRRKLLKEMLSVDELWIVVEEFNNLLAHDVPKFKSDTAKNEVIILLAEIIVERLPKLVEKIQQKHDQYCRAISSLVLFETVLQQHHLTNDEAMKLTDYINDLAFPITTNPRFYSSPSTSLPLKETNFASFFRARYKLATGNSGNNEVLIKVGDTDKKIITLSTPS